MSDSAVLRVFKALSAKLRRTHPAAIPPISTPLIFRVCSEQVSTHKGFILYSEQRTLKIPREVHFRFIIVVSVVAFQCVDRNAFTVLDGGHEGSISVVSSWSDENALFLQRLNDRPLACLGEYSQPEHRSDSDKADFQGCFHYGTCTVPAGHPTALGAVIVTAVVPKSRGAPGSSRISFPGFNCIMSVWTFEFAGKPGGGAPPMTSTTPWNE